MAVIERSQRGGYQAAYRSGAQQYGPGPSRRKFNAVDYRRNAVVGPNYELARQAAIARTAAKIARGLTRVNPVVAAVQAAWDLNDVYRKVRTEWQASMASQVEYVYRPAVNNPPIYGWVERLNCGPSGSGGQFRGSFEMYQFNLGCYDFANNDHTTPITGATPWDDSLLVPGLSWRYEVGSSTVTAPGGVVLGQLARMESHSIVTPGVFVPSAFVPLGDAGLPFSPAFAPATVHSVPPRAPADGSAPPARQSQPAPSRHPPRKGEKEKKLKATGAGRVIIGVLNELTEITDIIGAMYDSIEPACRKSADQKLNAMKRMSGKQWDREHPGIRKGVYEQAVKAGAVYKCVNAIDYDSMLFNIVWQTMVEDYIYSKVGLSTKELNRHYASNTGINRGEQTQIQARQTGELLKEAEAHARDLFERLTGLTLV